MAVGVCSLRPTIWATLILHLKSNKILTDEPYRSTGHGRRCDLRIATWNIERLRHKKFLEQILFACEQTQADILVLTETDHRVRLDYPYSFHTPPLTDLQPVFHNPTENRVSIYTNYPCVRQHMSVPVRFCNFSPNGECKKMADKGVQPLNDYTCRFRPSSLKCTDKSGLDGLQADK